MDVDFTGLSAHQRYKLLSSFVVPRPIALATTLGPGGVVNAARSGGGVGKAPAPGGTGTG